MKTLLALVVAVAIGFGGFIPAVHALTHHTSMQELGDHSLQDADHSEGHAHQKAEGALHDAIHHTHVEGSTPFILMPKRFAILPISPEHSWISTLSSRNISVPHQPPRHA